MGTHWFLSMFVMVCALCWRQVSADLCYNVKIGSCDCQEVDDHLEIDCSYRELKAYPDIETIHHVNNAILPT